MVCLLLHFGTVRKSFLIARDRYGIKPLYYSFQNKIFSFASEQKSIIVQKVLKKK